MTQSHPSVTGGPAPAMAEVHEPTALPAYTETAQNGSPAYSEYEVVSPRPLSPAAREPTSPVYEMSTTGYPTAAEEKRQMQESIHSGDEHPLDRSPFADNTYPAEQSYPVDRTVSPGALNRGLQVPSHTKFVASGFPFPDALRTYGITETDWSNFTGEISLAAKMSSEDWTLAIGGGAAAAIVSGVFLGWLGIIPGVIVGHVIHRKTEARKLTTALHGTGDLERKLLSWNETFFAPRGVLIRLDLPGQKASMKDMDIYTNKKRGCCGVNRVNSGEFVSDGSRKSERKLAKMIRKEDRYKRKAARKGRIVIIPLNKNPAVQREKEDLYSGSVA